MRLGTVARSGPGHRTAAGLALPREPVDFDAAVALFDQIDSCLPASIQGESVGELAGEGEY